MTNMIYRGVKHDGQRSTEVRAAKDLIYRGVAHNGMFAAPAARLVGFEMCYRGVSYILQANGEISGIHPAVPVVGSNAVVQRA